MNTLGEIGGRARGQEDVRRRRSRRDAAAVGDPHAGGGGLARLDDGRREIERLDGDGRHRNLEPRRAPVVGLRALGLRGGAVGHRDEVVRPRREHGQADREGQRRFLARPQRGHVDGRQGRDATERGAGGRHHVEACAGGIGGHGPTIADPERDGDRVPARCRVGSHGQRLDREIRDRDLDPGPAAVVPLVGLEEAAVGVCLRPHVVRAAVGHGRDRERDRQLASLPRIQGPDRDRPQEGRGVGRGAGGGLEVEAQRAGVGGDLAAVPDDDGRRDRAAGAGRRGPHREAGDREVRDGHAEPSAAAVVALVGLEEAAVGVHLCPHVVRAAVGHRRDRERHRQLVRLPGIQGPDRDRPQEDRGLGGVVAARSK